MSDDITNLILEPLRGLRNDVVGMRIDLDRRLDLVDAPPARA